jgi:hypothetical protein
MKRSIKAIACGSLIVAAQVVGAQPQSAAIIAKHQLSECMSKQMSANRSLSYNDAMRACKQRLQPPKDTLAAINPTDTGTKAH